MILKEFETLLHLFIIFNFAYAISNGFIKTLNEKISGAFKYVMEELISLDKKIKLAQDTIVKIQPKKDATIDSSQKLEVIRAKLNEFKDLFTGLNDRILEDIKTASLTKAFGYICLYAALYGLVLMLICGFCHKPCPTALVNSLFIFNILSTLFSVYCVLFEREVTHIIKLSFMRTIAFFIVFLLLSTILFLVLIFFNSETTWVDELFLTIFSIVIAGYHFVLYAIFSLRNAYILSKNMSRDIKRFKTDFDDFQNGEYSKMITFHEQYDKLKIKDS